MQSKRTVPINGNPGYESLRRQVNKLMARWGFAEKQHKGSTSWLAGEAHPKLANETFFKLCFYGPADVVWGIRKEFADRNDKLAALKWPLHFAVQPSPVEFIGFACSDEATAVQRVEKILRSLGEPRPELAIQLRQTEMNMDEGMVIQRLRLSRLRQGDAAYQEGHVVGTRWARQTAEVRELELLTRLRDEAEGRDGVVYLTGGDGQYTIDQRFFFAFHPDHHCDTAAAEAFWEVAVGDEPHEVENASFLRGFADGAVELWESVKDKL